MRTPTVIGSGASDRTSRRAEARAETAALATGSARVRDEFLGKEKQWLFVLRDLYRRARNVGRPAD